MLRSTSKAAPFISMRRLPNDTSAGSMTVVMLIREDELHILPVHQMAAGGCLLKRRNAAGDRVASAPDVFGANGLETWCADGLEAVWSAEKGALIVALGIAN